MCRPAGRIAPMCGSASFRQYAAACPSVLLENPSGRIGAWKFYHYKYESCFYLINFSLMRWANLGQQNFAFLIKQIEFLFNCTFPWWFIVRINYYLNRVLKLRLTLWNVSKNLQTNISLLRSIIIFVSKYKFEKH